MPLRRLLAPLAFLALAAPVFGTPAELSFEHDVRPILKTHCFMCHGEGEKLKGGVDLRLRRLMLGESDSGDKVMVPGQPAASAMLQLVREGEMPKKGKKLNDKELTTLEQWIA